MSKKRKRQPSADAAQKAHRNAAQRDNVLDFETWRARLRQNADRVTTDVLETVPTGA